MSSSVVLMVQQGYSALITKLVVAAVLGWGCYRAGKEGFAVERLWYIFYGVAALYFLNWVLVDILFVKTAILLQLLRSYVYVQFFMFLFLAYLLARQIRAGIFIFFIPYVLIFCAYGFVRKFLGENNQEVSLTILYVLIILFDIFGRRIAFPRMQRIFKAQYRPVFIAGFFLLVMAAHLPFFKTAIKSCFSIGEYQAADAWSKSEYLYRDMTGFVNKNITGDNVLIAYPFYKLDFSYFVHQKTFWDAYSPIQQIQYSKNLSDFKMIFANDLHLSLDKIAKTGFQPAWEEAWRNLPAGVVRRWNTEYGVTHIVRERDLPFPFPVIYENQHYRLYKITE